MKENKKQIELPLLEKSKEPANDSRRIFLKKAAYSTPVVFTLGQLTNPSKVHADGSMGPSGPPGNGWNPWN